jgi:hypothetical protein
MTVVFHRYRPGVAPYRGAIQSIVASRNHARNGYLTLDRLPGRGLRCNSHHRLDWGVRFRCGARNQRGVRHCGCFRLLRVRESRLKNAECNHKGEGIEAKVAGEAVLRTPLREYIVKNSIAWQKSPGQLNSIGKLPKAGSHTVLNGASICSKFADPEKSSLDVAYQQRLLALDDLTSDAIDIRRSSPVGN